MRKIIDVSFSLFILAVFISCKSKTASDARMLKFNLEKGKSYDFEMVMDMDQEVMNQTNKIGITAAYVINVADDNGTLKTLDIAYKDFKMNMNVMGQEIIIDASKKPDSAAGTSADNPMQMMTSAFSGIIGKKFTMKVTEAGKIEEVTGFEEMLRSMLENMAVNEEMKNSMSASLKNQFNGDKIKETFAPMFSVYPNKEVKVGDKWSNTYDLSSQAVQCKSEYVVKSFQGDNIVIDVTSQIEPHGKTDNPALSEMKMSGTQSGLMTLNSKSGLVVDAELTQNLETAGTLKMKIIGKTKMRGKEKS
jgi:hypothetical protein